MNCSLEGQKRQRLQEFLWRYITFPLIRNTVTKPMIKEYWQDNGWIAGDLFSLERHIQFPELSNCVGCFHKKPETLCVQWNINEAKMKWFARQEKLGMGTWLDSGVTYEELGKNRENFIPEMLGDNPQCDSGGCTD